MSNERPRSVIGFAVHEGKRSLPAERIRYAVQTEDPAHLYLPIGAKTGVEYGVHRAYAKHLAPVPEFEEAIAHSIAEKRDCLDALERMLKRQGVHVDLAQQFADLARYGNDEDVRLYTTQPLLTFRDFSVSKQEGLIHENYFKETDTRYADKFGILSHRDPESHRHIATSLHEMDADAWKLLFTHGVSHAMQKRYAEGLLSMCMHSDHDYLHQLIDPALPFAKHDFPGLVYSPNDHSILASFSREEVLLGLHAHIYRDIFAHEPAKKTALLEEAVLQAAILGDIQHTALTHARKNHAPPHEVAEIQEAIAYLAQKYGHRFFRVIDPHDPDLVEQKLHVQLGPSLRIASSVDRAFSKIYCTVPNPLEPQQEPHGGVATLIHHCQISGQDLYAHIHGLREVKLYTLPKASAELCPPERYGMPYEMVSLEEVVARFGQVVPELKESHAKAERERQEKARARREGGSAIIS